MDTYGSSINITNSNFINNIAYHGGVMGISDLSLINITSSTFINNIGDIGGVTYARVSLFNIIGSNFYSNKANSYGGIVFTFECSIYITDGTFEHNSGSFYTFNSNLTFNDNTRFENCVERLNKRAGAREEGGAVTSFQSTIIFIGVSSLSNNQARCGGAILAT